MNDNMVIIFIEVRQCELCGLPAEVRPYGPNGEYICFDCFDCGMKDEETTKRRFAQHVLDVLGQEFDA